MTLEVGYNKRKYLYDNYLNQINGIKFTYREIDIITCILHNRGEKKIAALLSISPRTVNTHVHNITLKISHGSRESIIDFVETSGKLKFIKQYYLHILIQSSFERQLVHISKTINRNKIKYSISAENFNTNEKLILAQLQSDLQLANLEFSLVDKECEHKLYVIKSKFAPQKIKDDIFLILDNQVLVNFNTLSDIEIIDLFTDYYLGVFTLLQKLINKKEIQVICEDFKKDCEIIKNSWEGAEFQLTESKTINPKFFKKHILIIVCFISIIIILIFLYLKRNFTDIQGQEMLLADLRLPQNNILLERSNVLEQITKKLENKKGIQIVALVGIGGAGKSTIARKYARESGAHMIWELNAETKQSLISSAEQLAYALSKTSEERQEIERIQLIKNDSIRKRNLYLFLSNKAKSYDNWLIIYDNVNAFNHIEKYFPYDASVWGNGKVIITTNDNNIIHNSYIPSENVIYVNALSNVEKFSLFNAIHPNSEHKGDKLDYTQCIDEIPPFPLDVSIAAHYIKETQISCKQYLEYSYEQQEHFMFTQKNILYDIGAYSRTRYDIIIMPVQRIINSSDKFKDLLLLISMIDSQNIPKKLLSSYVDEITVDSFIHELNKFSLITRGPKNSNQIPTFSIHLSTQDAIRLHFINYLQLAKNTDQLHKITSFIKNYIKQELTKNDLVGIKLLIPHIEALLTRDILFSDMNKAELYGELGISYFYLGNYYKSEKFLLEALELYKTHYNKDYVRIAEILARLGGVYRNIGNYQESKNFLEQALRSYSTHYGDNHIETAWISTYLGSVYRHIGDYNKSLILLEKAQSIYRRNYNEDHIKSIWNAAYLGQVYKNLGNYPKAQELLERSLLAYEKQYGSNHTKTAWIIVHLSSVYRHLGLAQKSKELLKKAVEIYKHNNGENSIEFAWSIAHLGAMYKDIGEIDESIKLLETSLAIYKSHLKGDHIIFGWIFCILGNAYRDQMNYNQSIELLQKALEVNEKHYGRNHIKIAYTLCDLASTNFALGYNKAALEYVNKAVDILDHGQHLYKYKPYEILADYHLSEAKKSENGMISYHDHHKSKAKECLTKALDIVQKNFPNNSAHITRIQSKINNLFI